MTSRLTAVGVGLVCIGLVAAQDVVPLTGFFHTWQYAAALALGAFVLIAYVNGALRGQDGALGKRIALAAGGALIATVVGIVSGLLGPDTQTVSHAPGTVAPIPDIRAAAFFTPVDAKSIATGGAHVIIRRPNRVDIDVGPGDRKFLQSSVLLLQPSVAAFVEAYDSDGNRLTITQPTNPSFLSPVLLFPNTQPIAGRDLPFDTFAIPAMHRVVKAVYLPPNMTENLRVPEEDVGKPAVLYAVDDESGKSLGLGVDPEGTEVRLAGVRMRASIGTYPKLLIASAPQPFVLAGGIALFLAGLAWTGLGLVPGSAVARAGAKSPSSS